MAEPRKTPDLYETDVYAWTRDQAAKPRARAHDAIDCESAAEEIESPGWSDRHEIHGRTEVLLRRLPKWRRQAGMRKAGRRLTIRDRRHAIGLVLRDSQRLRFRLRDVVPEEYPGALRDAAQETGLGESPFPTACPFTIEAILDPDFYPEAE